MRIALQDLTFRHPTGEDAQPTLDLMSRCEVAEYGTPDSDLDDLLHDWGEIDLMHDAWLAFTPAGDLVGYAAVTPWWVNLRYEFFADPSWENDSLGRELLARCEARGRELAGQSQSGDEMLARLYIANSNQRDRRVVLGASFEFVKAHFNMGIQMATLPQAPRWPEGVSVRCVRPGQDDRGVYDLIQAAFARPGRTPPDFAGWSEFMFRTDIFDSDLWFLSIAAGELVGACLCFEYPETGWVRQLGVAESWRKRGLGSALLQHAFAKFWERGYQKVELAVEARNETALKFYRGVGMERIRQYDEYEKTI